MCVLRNLHKAAAHPCLGVESIDMDTCKKGAKLCKLIDTIKKEFDLRPAPQLVCVEYLAVIPLARFMLAALDRDVRVLDYTGSMNTKERTKARASMEECAKTGTPCVMFVSKAGTYGVNLQCASTLHVYQQDWNPQNEIQFIGRADRLGQKEVVRIYRYYVKNSIEAYIEGIHLRKLADASVVDGKSVAPRMDYHALVNMLRRLTMRPEVDRAAAKTAPRASALVLTNPSLKRKAGMLPAPPAKRAVLNHAVP